MTHTPSTAFRHLPPRGKNAINHCLEFGHDARSVSVSVEYVLQHSGIWHKRGGRGEEAHSGLAALFMALAVLMLSGPRSCCCCQLSLLWQFLIVAISSASGSFL